MSTTTQTYGVVGMTCAHCVAAVTEEISTIDGVTDVGVDLAVGGTSSVLVTSTSPLGRDAVAAAIEEAGYSVADTHA